MSPRLPFLKRVPPKLGNLSKSFSRTLVFASGALQISGVIKKKPLLKGYAVENADGMTGLLILHSAAFFLALLLTPLSFKEKLLAAITPQRPRTSLIRIFRNSCVVRDRFVLNTFLSKLASGRSKTRQHTGSNPLTTYEGRIVSLTLSQLCFSLTRHFAKRQR